MINIGRHRQFHLYLFTLSFFGFGVAYDWFNISAYHRQYVADVKSGALTGPSGDLMNRLSRLTDGVIHFLRVLFAELIDHSRRSSNRYRPINHPALHHQTNDRSNNHEMNDDYETPSLSNDSFVGESIKYSDKSIHALLSGDQSINQIIDQANYPSDQSINQPHRPSFLIDTVTKLPLIDSVNQSNNLTISSTTNLKSPSVVIQSAEMCSPVDQPNKQSIDQPHNQAIEMSPATVLDLMRAEDALSYRRRSIDQSITQSLKGQDIHLSTISSPSINQSVSQPDEHSIKQPEEQFIEQFKEQLTQPINQSNVQSIKQSNNESIDQSIDHSQKVSEQEPPIHTTVKQSNKQSNKQSSNQSSPSGKKRSKNKNHKNRAN